MNMQDLAACLRARVLPYTEVAGPVIFGLDSNMKKVGKRENGPPRSVQSSPSQTPFRFVADTADVGHTTKNSRKKKQLNRRSTTKKNQWG